MISKSLTQRQGNSLQFIECTYQELYLPTESIEYISGCPVLANSEFMQGHDKAASCLHWKICKAFSLPVADKEDMKTLLV